MNNKYLLYIDILGFSKMVKHSPSKVTEIYKIIDGLNVHKHHAFSTIIVSDSIIVYNKYDPTTISDHNYLVMYSCEFAQDLLYRSIGKDFHFRSVLTYGGFEHYKLENIEAYFGPALIEAYTSEKEISCTGHFIHQSCAKYNKIFPTKKYNENLSFVYLTQAIDSFNLEIGMYPDQFQIIEGIGLEYDLMRMVIYLENIYKSKKDNPDPHVREKYLSTWDFYFQRYGDLLSHLEQNDFDPKVISRSIDWALVRKHIMSGEY
jgi:hypothetical protein